MIEKHFESEKVFCDQEQGNITAVMLAKLKLTKGKKKNSIMACWSLSILPEVPVFMYYYNAHISLFIILQYHKVISRNI